MSSTTSVNEKSLLAQLDRQQLPRHVGIIMDGNGRWARQRGFLERIRGHEAGIEAVRAVIETAAEIGIGALTLYAFSKENWNRPAREVRALMNHLEKFLYAELDNLNEHDIRLVASGSLDDLPAASRKALTHVCTETAAAQGLTLNLALSYGGRSEIAEAVRQLARQVREGAIDPESIDEVAIAKHLYHPELGDPDLIIRTSGEFRVSNFMIWQAAYSEFYITPVLWPDFGRAEFLQAMIAFQGRERRFGGL
jgi:undecaprenyl diphosphate synthase